VHNCQVQKKGLTGQAFFLDLAVVHRA